VKGSPLKSPAASFFSPDNYRLWILACLAQLLLIAAPFMWAPQFAVIGLGLVAAGVAVLFSVQRALLLTLVLSIVVPGSMQTAFNLPGGIRFQEALLLAVAFMAFIDWVYRRHLGVRPSPADLPLAVFLLCVAGATAVGLLHGYGLMPALRDARYPYYYLVFFLVTHFVDRDAAIRLFAPALVLAGVMVSFGYILEFFGAIDLSTGTSFVRVARLQGLIMPVSVLLLFNQVVHDPRRYPRILLLLLFLPMGLSLVLTVGRSMWVALTVGLIATIYMRDFARPQEQRNRWRTFFLVGAIVGLMGLVVIFLQNITGATIGAHVIERSSGLLDLARAPTLLGRLFSYSATLEEVGRYPFLGSGMGATLSYPLFNFDLGIFETWTTWTIDSLYLTLLFKMGVVGLVAFAWLLLRCLRLAYRSFRDSAHGKNSEAETSLQALSSGLVAVICAQAAMGFSDGSMVNGRFALVYGVIFGLIAVLARRRA
jgi:hypothetical protein